MAKKLRLGIVGLGAQGSMYAQFIAKGMVPNMEIGAICDIDPAKADAAESTYPGRAVLRRLHRACWRAATWTPSSPASRTTCTRRWASRPSSGTFTRSSRSRPGSTRNRSRSSTTFAATKPELTFGIMFNQRNNPLYRRIKEIVDNGEIGKIRRTNWIITNWWRPQGYYDQSAWRATWGGEGGGVLVNQAPHQLDLWQWICGIPKSVYAKVAYGFRRNIAVEDEVTAVVDYGDGATGVFVTATHDLVGTDRFEILGDSGKIVVENSKTATVTRLHKPERELSDGMDADDVKRLFTGQLDTGRLLHGPRSSSSSRPGEASTPASWRTSRPTSSTGRRCSRRDRTASTVSGWPTPSTSPAGPAARCALDFDEDEYLAELNKRIRAEGTFAERT